MNYTNLMETVEKLVKEATNVSLLKAMNKPLDTGNGNLTASIGRRGELLSLGGYHSTQGYMVAHSFGQFPYEEHYNTPYVRKYRAALANLDDGLGFGLVPQFPSSCFKQYWLNGTIPCVRAEQEDLDVEILSFPDGKESCLYQVFICQNKGHEAAKLEFMLGGKVSVNRSSFAQLTEGGPIQPPALQNELRVSKEGFSVANANLGAYLSAALYGLPDYVNIEEYEETKSEPVGFRQEIQLELPPQSKKIFVMRYALTQNEEQGSLSEIQISKAFKAKLEGIPTVIRDLAHDHSWAYAVLRNLDYILSCCLVTTEPGMTCVITDHQLLPLAWNRDAYYMVRLLYQYCRQFRGGLSLEQRQELQNLLRNHLDWLFRKAERHKGFWGRSYLTTGKLKDQTFQLDQQCYPILELLLYAQTFDDEAFVARLLPSALDVVDGLLALRTRDNPFLPTEETPADDAVIYPYHFSSHILLVETLKAMDMLQGSSKSPGGGYLGIAEELTQAIKRRMMTDCSGQKLFAYLTDGNGNYQLYHDANDLPSVYAPEWEFCGHDDEVWLKTMQFGFSSHNQGGYYPGRYGGLGSIHSPYPWPLGDVQELIFARLTHDAPRRERVLGKLLAVIQADGMLPEAIDPNSSAVLSRHWFAWPGATFAFELLKMQEARTGG